MGLYFQIGMIFLAANVGFFVAAIACARKYEKLQDKVADLNRKLAQRDLMLTDMADCTRRILFAMTDDDAAPMEVKSAIEETRKVLEKIS